MRCVNCQRSVADDDSQCPFCGCPVLTAAPNPAHTRVARELGRLWAHPSGGDNVVSLVAVRRAALARWLRDAALEVGCWGVIWGGVAALLGVATSPGTWVVYVLALSLDLALLTTYRARPWFFAWTQEVETTHDDPPGSQGAVGMSSMPR